MVAILAIRCAGEACLGSSTSKLHSRLSSSIFSITIGSSDDFSFERSISGQKITLEFKSDLDAQFEVIERQMLASISNE